MFGGDVALGYMPSETVSLLMSLSAEASFVMGNADRELVRIWDGGMPRPGLFGGLGAWCAGRLDRRQRDFLASFATVVEQEVDGAGDVLFCHGTPRSDEEILTPGTPDDVFVDVLKAVSADIVVGGHTHMQMDREVAGKRFVNAGSVGMPYGGTGAFWLRLGPAVDLRHTAYDLEAAAAAIRATGGPNAAEMAAGNVLTTPTAATAIEQFRAAGRPPSLVRPSRVVVEEAEGRRNRQQLSIIGLDQLPATLMHHPMVPVMAPAYERAFATPTLLTPRKNFMGR